MNQNQETQKKIMDVRPFVSKWKSVKDWVCVTELFVENESDCELMVRLC